MLLPSTTLCEAGVAESTKPGGMKLVTMNVVVALCIRLPLVPVIVRVFVPTGVVLVVVTVMVEVPSELIEEGLKLAFAPEGKLVALSDTAPVKLFAGATVTV